jgi:hypothetical protein
MPATNHLAAILFLTTLCFFNRASANPDGAGACFEDPQDIDMFSFHHGGPDKSKGSFEVKVSSPTYLPGCTYTVSLCCGSHKGFLIYARTDTVSRVGKFTLAGAMSTAKYQHCGGSLEATLTHTDSKAKPAMHFTWTAPDVSIGTINILGTIVVGPKTNWYESSVPMSLNTQPNATCPPLPLANVCPQSEDHDMDGMDMSDSTVMGGHGMGGSMTFNTNWQGVSIVFKEWTITSQSGYVCTLLFVAALALMFEVLQIFQVRMDQRFKVQNFQQALGKVFPVSTNSSGSGSNVELSSPKPISTSTVITISETKSDNGLQPAQPCCVEVDDDGNIMRGLGASLDKDLHRSSHSKLAFPERTIQVPMEDLPFTTKQHALRTLLHMFRTFVSLFIMMVFMTMEVGLVLAVIGGGGLGYFLFARHIPVQRQVGCHSA